MNKLIETTTHTSDPVHISNHGLQFWHPSIFHVGGHDDHLAAERDGDEQHRRLVAHYHPYLSQAAPPSVRSAINDYTGNWSPEVTRYLINGGRTKTDDELRSDPYVNQSRYREIDQGLQKMAEGTPRLPEAAHVYSRISTNLAEKLPSSVGQVFHSPAWISSSVRPQLTARVAHFHLPENSRMGTYVASLSKYPTEQEMLLHADTRWRYLGSTSGEVKNPINGFGDIRDVHTMYHFEPAGDAWPSKKFW